MIKKILVPVDGSDYSALAIDKAKEIAEAFKSEIILLNVFGTSEMNYPSYPYKFSSELIKSYKNEGRIISDKILDEAENLLCGLCTKVSTVSLEGNTYEAIIKYVEENDVDLVIMGSGGVSGVRNALGSVTRKVVLSITKPMMIVR